MSKDRAVSMRKVIRFVNQYPNDWIEQVYGDEPYLAKHLQSKWQALGKDKSTTSYEAIMQLMTALDYENEIKLMEWIDKKFAKGGKAGEGKSQTPKDIKKRLEHLRKELRAERISYGELAELQSLKDHIDPSDVELLEAAGVPEFPDDEEMANGGEAELMKKSGIILVDYPADSTKGKPKPAPHTIDGQIKARKANLKNVIADMNDPNSDTYPDMLKSWKKSHEETLEKLYALKKSSGGSTMAKGGKTREVKVYQFEELSKDAQKKALDNFRDINVDFDDWSYPILKDEEGWEDKLKKQGWGEVEISFSGFWSQGDGASFVTKHIDVKKLMKHYGLDKKYPLAFEHADQLSGYVNRDTHHYVHEKSTSVSINTDDMSSDEYDALKDKKKFDEEVSSVEDDLEQIKIKLSREIYKDLEKYYESLTSDESVKDTIEANEYEFLEDGRRPNFEKGGKAGGGFWDYYAGHSGLVYGNYLSPAEKKGIGGVLLGVGLGIAGTLGYQAGKKHNIRMPQTESDVKRIKAEIAETEKKHKQEDLKNLPSKIRFYDNFPKGVEHKGTNYRVYEKYEDGKWSKISNDQFDDFHLMKDEKGELIYERKKKSEQGKFVFYKNK